MNSTLEGSSCLLIIISSSLEGNVWTPKNKTEKLASCNFYCLKHRLRVGVENAVVFYCKNKHPQRSTHLKVVVARTAPLIMPRRQLTGRILPSTESRKTQAVKGRYDILPVFTGRRGWEGDGVIEWSSFSKDDGCGKACFFGTQCNPTNPKQHILVISLEKIF